MVNREQFEEICNKYGLDSKKLIKNNENVLEKTDYNSICYVLDFLRDTLKVSPNNIEKCPSIFYFRVDTIEENWNFLNEKKINRTNNYNFKSISRKNTRDRRKMSRINKRKHIECGNFQKRC